MADLIDDSVWTPPSEAEMKILDARRERSDKISKLMGQYLLKGYKMLGTCCAECGTILLKDRSQEDYCVGCSELSSDVAKDDPAVNNEAARRQVAEEQQRNVSDSQQASTSVSTSVPTPLPVPLASLKCEPVRIVPDVLDCDCLPDSAAAAMGDTCRPHVVASSSSATSTLHNAMCVVEAKLTWATAELDACAGVEASVQLCQLVRTCAESISALQRAADTRI